MNFLSKIFGNNQNKETTKISTQENHVTTINELGEINKDIFIDEHPPGSDFEEATNKDSILKVFLNTDFSIKGFDDGLEFHSNNILETGKKKIKAEFRQMIDFMIEQKKSDMLNLKNQMAGIEGLSDNLTQQLKNCISETEITIKKLESEKVLSVEDEGLVSCLVHNYQHGYMRGTESYLIEKSIGISTGMFNN